MKKTVLSILFATALFSASAQTAERKFYFDFGPNDVTNGNVTANPDLNSNHWNNIIVATLDYTSPDLINSAGTTSTLALKITATGFSTSSGIRQGGLTTPYASQFTGNEDFAINTATQDYFWTSLGTNGPSIEFSGLNPAKKYRFKILGSRNSNTDRTSKYTFQGAGTAVFGTHNTSSVAGLGGSVYTSNLVTYNPATTARIQDYSLTSVEPFTVLNTYYGNNSTVYTSEYIIPDVNNKIKLTTTAYNGGFAYINALKIEEYNSGTTEVAASNSSQLRVYPTQVSDILNVDGANQSVDIFTVSGVKVLTQKGAAISKLNVSTLYKGMYLLVVDGKETFRFNKN